MMAELRSKFRLDLLNWMNLLKAQQWVEGPLLGKQFSAQDRKRMVTVQAVLTAWWPQHWTRWGLRLVYLKKAVQYTLSPDGLSSTGLLWRFFPQLYWDVVGKLNGKVFKVYNMIHMHIVDWLVLYPNPAVPVQSTHDALTLLTPAPATCLPSAWSHLRFIRSHVAELTCYKACAKHV